MSFRHGKTSLLAFGETLQIDDVEFWDILLPPVIPSQPDDFSYVVLQGDTPDGLADKFYGDVVLYRVLLIANDFDLPPFGFLPGATIRVPSPRFILQEFFKGSKRRGTSRRQ